MVSQLGGSATLLGIVNKALGSWILSREGIGMCLEWHYTTRDIGGWRRENQVCVLVISPYAYPRVA